MSSESLVGRLVKLFLDGSWTFEGKVILSDSNKFVIETKDGMTIVYKAKVNAALLLNEQQETVIEDAEELTNGSANEDDLYSKQPNYYKELNSYQVFIPETMLDENYKEHKDYETDFSISVSSLKSIGSDVDTSKKARSYRKEDQE